MFEYLRSTRYNPTTRKQDKLQPGSWIRVEEPTEDEITILADKFKLDIQMLRDALDPHEIPRVETEDDKLYFITRLPDTSSTMHDFTTPLMIVIGQSQIFTISRKTWMVYGSHSFPVAMPQLRNRPSCF